MWANLLASFELPLLDGAVASSLGEEEVKRSRFLPRWMPSLRLYRTGVAGSILSVISFLWVFAPGSAARYGKV